MIEWFDDLMGILAHEKFRKEVFEIKLSDLDFNGILKGREIVLFDSSIEFAEASLDEWKRLDYVWLEVQTESEFVPLSSLSFSDIRAISRVKVELHGDTPLRRPMIRIGFLTKKAVVYRLFISLIDGNFGRKLKDFIEALNVIKRNGEAVREQVLRKLSKMVFDDYVKEFVVEEYLSR